MKLVIVGPGMMSIPPTGWGAIEILIWDYYCFLKELNNNTLQGPNIKSYNFSQSKNDLGYEIITSNNDDLIKPFIENENVSKIEDVDEDISIKIKDNIPTYLRI